MPKIYSFVFITLIAVFLAGCSPDTPKKIESAKAPEESEMPTVQEILENTSAAAANLKSFSTDMKIAQQIQSNSHGDKMDLESNITTDLFVSPLSFHQEMSMKMKGSDQVYNSETYFADNGMFFYDASEKKWMKVPDEMYDQFIELSKQYTNPAEEIRKIQSVTDEFAISSKQGQLILKLKASGEEFNSFVKGYIQQSMPPDMADSDEIWNDLKVNEIKYEIVIDEKTYLPTSIHIFMNLDMKTETETIKVNQSLTGRYSNFDRIEKITIPDEVLNGVGQITN